MIWRYLSHWLNWKYYVFFRKCGDDYHDTCDTMCCGRGHIQVIHTVTNNRCNCKHIWCCYVECDVCKVDVKEYYCNWNRWHNEEYPTMHYFEIPRNLKLMIAYKSISQNFSSKLHCGNVVHMPSCGKLYTSGEQKLC